MMYDSIGQRKEGGPAAPMHHADANSQALKEFDFHAVVAARGLHSEETNSNKTPCLSPPGEVLQVLAG